MTTGERGPPLEELVAGAEREARRGHEDEQPAAGPQRRRAKQDLADQDRGDEALDEVTKAVVVVPGQTEDVLSPEAERHPGVGIVAADDEDERVDSEERVGETGQRKAPIRRYQNRSPDQDGKDLQPPGGAVVRRDARHDERRADDNHEDAQIPVGHRILLRTEPQAYPDWGGDVMDAVHSDVGDFAFQEETRATPTQSV